MSSSAESISSITNITSKRRDGPGACHQPKRADALAGRKCSDVVGETDAALKTLELAQRLDPELNPIDRFALSLAYYLKGRYDAAIEEAERNLRENPGANFSRIVLAAAYAEQNRADQVAVSCPQSRNSTRLSIP